MAIVVGAVGIGSSDTVWINGSLVVATGIGTSDGCCGCGRRDGRGGCRCSDHVWIIVAMG